MGSSEIPFDQVPADKILEIKDIMINEFKLGPYLK